MVDLIKKLRTQMRWIMIVIAVTFLLSTFLMYEGRSGRSKGSGGGMEDYKVAEINGKSLMRSDLEKRLYSYLEQTHKGDMASLDMPALYQSVLDQFALESQMAREVKNAGISVSDAEAEQAMKDYADQAYPTREAFYQTLERSGVSVADYKKNIANQIATEQFLRSVIGDVTVSEDDSVKFYDTMKSMLYSQPAGFKVCLASFASTESASALRDKLSQGVKWVEATSGDSFVSKDIIRITQEAIFFPDSAFDSAPLSSIKELKAGEVSQVFEVASNDFAVALKDERLEERETPYDEVSSDIRVLLRQQKEREILGSFYDGILKKANVVILDKSLFEKHEAKVSAPAGSAVSPDAGVDVKEAPASEEVKPEIKEEASADVKPEVKEEASADVKTENK